MAHCADNAYLKREKSVLVGTVVAVKQASFHIKIHYRRLKCSAPFAGDKVRHIAGKRNKS